MALVSSDSVVSGQYLLYERDTDVAEVKKQSGARRRTEGNSCDRNAVTRMLVHLMSLGHSGTSKCLPAEAHSRAECRWATG